MKRLLYTLLALLIFSIPSSLKASPADATSADSAYNAEDFELAAKIYNEVIEREGSSAPLYFNLGNTYYRLGYNGKAMLNYERALRLDPTNNDIKANINFVKQRLQDKVGEQGNVISNGFNNFINSLHSNSWAIISLISFIIFVATTLLYFFSEKIGLRKVGFFTALTMIIASVATGFFASHAAATALSRDYAIITAPTTTLSTSPRLPKNKREEAMTLHEGIKLKILDSVSITNDTTKTTWFDVIVDNNNRAWVKSSDIEII